MIMMTTQKRKAVDQFNHDFSDFSLSSPATKIRRLDHVELAPIIEEEEEEQVHIAAEAGVEVENEERAIVLFNPPANTLINSPPTFSLAPPILSRLKGLSSLFNKSSSSCSSHQDEDTDTALEDVIISNQSTAVVPWVKSPLYPCLQSSGLHASEEADTEDQQEEEEEVATSMDIEQGYYAAAVSSGNATEYEGPSVGFHQWQQQHCSMVPPHSAAPAPAPTPTPVAWFN